MKEKFGQSLIMIEKPNLAIHTGNSFHRNSRYLLVTDVSY
jgi:hypothetical protein